MTTNQIIEETKKSVTNLVNVGGATVQSGAEVFETPEGRVHCILSPSNSGASRNCSTRISFKLDGKPISKSKLESILA